MTPSPTSGSPYPSVGRDPCVPPHDMHVFLPAGHAGPALQGTGRVQADRVVRPYDGSRSRAKRDVVPQGHLFRCAPLRDAVPYGWFSVPIRRAGPMCPAARHACFPSGGAQAVSGRTESSTPTAGQGAVRNGTSRTPSPTHVYRRRTGYIRSMQSKSDGSCVGARRGGAQHPRKSDGFCVLPMANRRRRTVCTSRRFDDGRAQKTRFYFVGRMRFNISISPSRYVLAARLRS